MRRDTKLGMKHTLMSFMAVSALALSLVACSSPPSQKEADVAPNALAGPSISIMTFNVENLFDTEHDEGKNDVTFLPLALKQSNPKLMAMCDEMTTEYYKKECRESDWNEQIFETKISRVAQVVRQISGGMGPDILLLAEIENKNALDLLRDRKLQDVGYETYLLEGDDERGIDVALMTRLKKWDEPILHKIPFQGKDKKETEAARKTRGILEVRLQTEDGTKLSVFVVHMPSQSNPVWRRQQAVEFLNQLKSQLPADVLAIAGGDFNIGKAEDQQTGLVSKTLASQWLVSHIEGCKGCLGTEVYKKEWSFLDMLLFSPSMKSGRGTAKWVLDAASIRIPKDVREQTNQFGEPNRFSPEGGVSDHFPMFAKIVLVK